MTENVLEIAPKNSTEGPPMFIMGGLTKIVEVGDDVIMSVIDPRLSANSSLEWHLRYGDATVVRYLAAEIVSDYDSLCNSKISTAEAISRLRALRKARKNLEARHGR